MRPHDSLRIDQDDSEQASNLKTPIQIVGRDKLKLGYKNYEKRPEIHISLSSTEYSASRMKMGSDFLTFNYI